MTADHNDALRDPYHEPLADYGKAAVMVPLIIGGAIVAALIILWQTHARNVRLLEMSEIEVEVRRELRDGYRQMRAMRPGAALERAGNAGELMQSLRQNLAPDYAELRVAINLLEGESLFMQDCGRLADESEECFTKALGLMTHASGETWQFGMLGRARARLEQRKYDEAIADLSAVLDRNPSYGAAYYWRAMARRESGDAKGAAADRERARALDSWPPLRDFMHSASDEARDILGKKR